jgi:hypothetical protein
MNDHKKLKAEDSRLIDIESICVERTFLCVGTERGEERKPNSIVLYFDENEDFMHKIRRVWLNKRKQPNVGWPKQIADIVSVSSSTYYAIQVVDLITWLDHRHYTHGDVNNYRSWFQFPIQMKSGHFDFLDYGKMKSEPKFFRQDRKSH